MALIVKDRVRELSTTTGTGTFTLGGAPAGFQTFATIGDGNQTYYTIADAATGDWESGIGVYTASGTTLTRDTVLDSSNAGALVSFAAGSKDVFVVYPAERSVSQADVGTAPNEIPLNQYLGSMAYQNLENVVIDGGVATFESATITSIQNDTAISNVEPSLMLNFAAVKKLDPRITFARASGATYYDGQTVAKAEENLQIRSQTFVNWTSRSSAAKTDNQAVAPDGTTTAGQIASGSSVATDSLIYFSHLGAGTFIAGSTISCFFKAGTSSIAFIQGREGGNPYAVYDLSTQTLLGSSGGTPSLVDFGSGWFRIILSNLTTGANYFAIGGKDTYTSGAPWGNGTWTAGNTIFAWGAQLEQRSSVTAYTPTTTQPITNYIPVLQTASANVARFDHNPVTGESLGLLIEEQRTNGVTYSEQFDNAAWTKIAATVTANQVVAPDGTLTMGKLTEATSTGSHLVRQIYTTANASDVLTYSIYVKAAERSSGSLRVGNLGSPFPFFNVSFDLQTLEMFTKSGSTGSVLGFSLENVGNGIYRLTLSGSTGLAGNVALDFYLSNEFSNDRQSYTGDGTSGIYIWGAQVEAGAFPTSYISTSASQVTRSADSASMTGTNFSEWYRPDEGSAILHYVENGNDASSSGVNFNDGSTANRIGFFIDGSGATPIQPTFVVVSGNSVQASIVGSAPPINTGVKTATAYDNNSFILSINGAVIGSDVVGVVPKVTQMQIGNQLNSSFANRSIKKLAYYPARLSDAELQEMTEQ